MCLIVSILLLVLSYNLYMANNLFLSVGSFIGSIFFIILMVKNIQHVKSLKKEQKGKEK